MRQRGDGGGSEPVVGQVVAGFLGRGQAEEAGVKPWLGIDGVVGAAAQGAGDLTGRQEPGGIGLFEMSEPGIGGNVQSAVDEPTAVDAAGPLGGIGGVAVRPGGWIG